MARMLGKMEMDICPVCKAKGRKNAEHPGLDCVNSGLGTRAAKIKERRAFQKAVKQDQLDEV